MDCSPPGSSVHGIFQEWVAIPFCRGSSWPCKAKANDVPSLIWTSKASELDLKSKMTDTLCFYKNGSEVKSLSRIRLFATPWTVAYQAPSLRFSRQEYWSGLPFPSPEDLPKPGIEPGSSAWQANSWGNYIQYLTITYNEKEYVYNWITLQHIWKLTQHCRSTI